MTMLSIQQKLSGEFRAVLNEGKENQVDTGWMPNLVLNGGLDRIGSGLTGMFTYCSVGTGSTAPANGQTALTSYVASQGLTSSSGTNLGTPTYAGQITCVYTFSQGAVVGNLAEFGVGWASSGGGSLFSRCLFLDSMGSPTTLTVISIDQLTIYYRLTNTPVITDLSGSVTISSVAYPYTARLASATTFFNNNVSFQSWVAGQMFASSSVNAAYAPGCTLGAITSVPSGTATALTNMTSSIGTYTIGNYYIDTTISLNPATGNVSGGIGGLALFYGASGTGIDCGAWQWVFSTPIPKDNTKTLTLVLRYTWGR